MAPAPEGAETCRGAADGPPDLPCFGGASRATEAVGSERVCGEDGFLEVSIADAVVIGGDALAAEEEGSRPHGGPAAREGVAADVAEDGDLRAAARDVRRLVEWIVEVERDGHAPFERAGA